MIRKLLLCCLVLLLLLSPSLSNAGSSYSIKYDLFFKRWGEFYFPYQDWKHWKAQGLAESGLNPRAVSWCGARGIMQLMPGTAKELGINPFDNEANVQGGIKYDKRLYRYWPEIKDRDEQRDFVFASYNSGPGNIIRAYRLAGKPLKWEIVAGKLPAVTGKNAAETCGYVRHIRDFYRRINSF